MQEQESIVRIGDLNFEFRPEHPEDQTPSLEIENDASMVYVRVTKDEAMKLKKLLERFILAETPADKS